MRLSIIISAIPFFMGIERSTLSETVDFDVAMKKGLIQVTVKSLGGHACECLEATIRNKTAKSYFVRFAPGTLFKPTDQSFQDILLTSERKIQLASAPVKLKLSGYCSAASKRSPQAGEVYKTDKANPQLIQLAEYLNKNDFPAGAIQNAVWSVSDGENIAEIYDELRERVEPLRNTVAQITGRENVWYSTETTEEQDEQGYINQEAVNVSGKVDIKVERSAKMFQEVCKKTGQLMWKPDAAIDLPSAGTFKYKFNLKVTGWEKGEYVVKTILAGKVIAELPFRI